MSVIDRVKEHFEAKGIKKIEVAEWGEEGKPLEIYCKPFTLAEKRNLFRGAKQDDLAVLVDAIVLKARDGENNKVFKLVSFPPNSTKHVVGSIEALTIPILAIVLSG